MISAGGEFYLLGALIPACVNDGGGTNITELVHSSSLDGYHRFFGVELNSIHVSKPKGTINS